MAISGFEQLIFVGRGGTHIKWVSMCRSRLKRRGLTEVINLKKWVVSELIEL